MADPEKAGDLDEVDSVRQDEEDTSAAEHGKPAGSEVEQADNAKLDEVALLTEQEQNPDSTAYEPGASEEPGQGPDAAEEPVQAPDVVEDSVQGLAATEEATQALAAMELTAIEEPDQAPEQEQNPDLATYEPDASKELAQRPDVAEELTTAEEPVQVPDVEESVQGLAAAEVPSQARDAAVELTSTEESVQGVVTVEELAEGLPQGLGTAEQQGVPHVESDLTQEDIVYVQDLGGKMSSGISGTTTDGSESGSRRRIDFATDMLMQALASEGAKFQQHTREPNVTVKFMLHPDIQIFTKAFSINQTVDQIKQYFVTRLKIPMDLLQIMKLGRIIENDETLWDLGAQPYGIIQVDMFSLDEENFPVKASKLLQEYYMPDVITVRVQTDPDTFQDIEVGIKRPTFEKPFLGGFRHKETGTEYHNAGSQTDPKKRPDKGYEEFCRSTQTVYERRKLQQTRNTTSTQMTKIGVYMSNITDKLIEPKEYVTAEEYHARRLKATIVMQTYYRRWLAINIVKKLKEELRLRLEWEEEEERRKQRERADRLLKEYNRRLFPKTKDDFELLYHALELWRQEELERINETFTGAERKAALCGLLEKEAQLIASIGRHKINADEENQQKAILSFLEKCAAPKKWKAFDGKITEMDTQFTLRARELLEIYRSISMKDLPEDERIDVLLTLKHTVKEHECKLTHEIVELIDREVDLMMRKVKDYNLEGLRQRICTLFLQYIKTPFFNPEVARLLKVPPDPMKLYHNIHFCLGCKRYLPSTDFAISASSHTVGRCRLCCKLDNQARKREAFLKYKRMLLRLRDSEVKYNDNAKIAFIIQQQDLHYMIEHFWGSQSALSAADDLYDLVMARWDKYQEWSPWNCILLRNIEAEAHLRLKSLEKAYEPAFIHRIKHKHMLARNYFSQFPELAGALHKDDKPTISEDLLVTKPLTPGPSK
ncbi:IQ motif and ubiquitin-like domain-containing protein [Anolis sagrei]|uniref:IQ motif and ubiquitin-like domain-containing protein n=1 Tax=Anolis sagrei TaxID=38937 RepID=UPI0035226995